MRNLVCRWMQTLTGIHQLHRVVVQLNAQAQAPGGSHVLRG